MDINNSIECSVPECKFHSEKEDYCTLNKIKIQKHDSVATFPESTDCASFQRNDNMVDIH